MKKVIIFIVSVIGIVIIISLIRAYNDSIDEQLKKDLQNNEYVANSENKEFSSKKILVDSIEFECYFLNDNFARIKSDTLIIDTAILNKVIRELDIKVNPVYFHSKSLTDTGEEYATAFNYRTTISDYPPRTKEDVKINLHVLKLKSAITDCDLILKDNAITIESANSYIFSLEDAIELINNTNYKSNKRVTSVQNNLKNKIISAQAYLYPKARKAYVKVLADKMWENNIDVSSSGTTITLVGGVFANNKNKQDAVDAIYPILKKFRFKRINVKWIEHDDNYTYWNIESPKDREI